MRFRWQQGTGKPPQGAIITSDDTFVIWQILQYLDESICEDEDGTWVDVPVEHETRSIKGR